MGGTPPPPRTRCKGSSREPRQGGLWGGAAASSGGQCGRPGAFRLLCPGSGGRRSAPSQTQGRRRLCWARPVTGQETGSESLRRLLKATQLVKVEARWAQPRSREEAQLGSEACGGGVSQCAGGFGSRGRSWGPLNEKQVTGFGEMIANPLGPLEAGGWGMETRGTRRMRSLCTARRCVGDRLYLPGRWPLASGLHLRPPLWRRPPQRESAFQTCGLARGSLCPSRGQRTTQVVCAGGPPASSPHSAASRGKWLRGGQPSVAHLGFKPRDRQAQVPGDS